MKPLVALAHAAAKVLQESKQTLAVAESSCGGTINAALVGVPGASAFYLGGVVIYTAASREALLGIDKKQMAGMRPATEPFAQLLAARVREKLGATWAIAETGATGPGGNRYGDAPGHACIAVSGPVNASITIDTGSAEREANMELFARQAIELLDSCLREADEGDD